MASSYSDESAANVHDVCTSNNGDNDSFTVYNIEFSQTNGLHNCEDVTTEDSSRKLNVLSSLSNDPINTLFGCALSRTARKDVCIHPVCVTMTDSLSTNNAMETPPVILTPLSVNTPDYLDNS